MAPVFPKGAADGTRFWQWWADAIRKIRLICCFKKESVVGGKSVVGKNQLVRCFFRGKVLVDWGNCCTFAVALFGNESEKAV
ncbi:MAG: hypothetical protein IJK41_03780 [Muribaculaceae bacterium]|nr:hypothetical protein [Muribaculaceae bacterium]